MARTSPIHYIAPSSIGITPNANGSYNDLAVYIANGTKIKVYSPQAGIGMQDGQYKEWTLTGRNRRLGDGTKPYTIYAKLPRPNVGGDSGYLIFAPKILHDGVWYDRYPYVAKNTSAYTNAVNSDNRSDYYYYIRLGDVSLPEDRQRTVTLDTGILGTEQFNNEYALNPDALPLRIELGCTINDEDVGSTPYIYWDQQLVLTATLVEGWTGTDIKRFDHWEIARNSGSDSDASWPSQQRQEAFASSGSITLSHTKGADDDFASAVSALYTITAWGYSEDPEDQTLVPLATACISILAETVEKYELSCSADIVSYNPQTESYTPAGGVAVRFRATDQRGDVFMLTKKQFDDSGISVAYAPVGSSSWQQLTPSGAPNVVATVTVPASAFTSQQSVNVRLLNSVGKELATKTIAFVRDGEDSKEREWIFLQSAEPITFGDLTHPYPSNISYGEVDPAGAAGHVTNDKNQEGWVPEGWWDEMQGTDSTNRYEYGAYRDFVHDETNGDHWGDFTTPKMWSHYGKDGKDSAVATCLPSVVSVPTDKSGKVLEDFRVAIDIRIYSTDFLTLQDIQIASGGENVVMSNGTIVEEEGGDLSFSGTKASFGDASFDGPVLVLGDNYSYIPSGVYVVAQQGTVLNEHCCELVVRGLDSDGELLTAVAPLNIQRNIDAANSPIAVYAWNQDPDHAPSISGTDYPPAGWSKRITARPGEGYCLWMSESVQHADGTIDTWSPPVRISGVDGTPGEDAKDTEWIYKLDDTTGYDSTIDKDGVQRTADYVATHDDFVPYGWVDNALSISINHPNLYASFRKYNTATRRWGVFQTPIVWSHWGERGIDGDGVEYAFVRTNTNTAPTINNRTEGEGAGNAPYGGKTYLDDDFRPLSSAGRCTDDAAGVDSTHKYEWALARKKTDPDSTGQRTWTKYEGTMKLWNVYAEGITKKSETSYYITNNTGVRPAGDDPGWSETKPALQQGWWLFTKTVITWSDDSTTTLYSDERNPNDGTSGQDIVVDGATEMLYSCKDSNTVDPTTITDWASYSQVTKRQGWWLWSKATTYYKKADSAAGAHDAGSSINYNVSYIAADGTSPYFADIDNEMDSLACDFQGNAVAAYDKYIGVHIWHGSTEQAITTLTTNSITGITITPDAANKRIRVQITAGTNIAAVNAIVITIASSDSGNKTLRFTLNGVRPGAPGGDAVIYSLLPSTNSISKKKDGSYVPAGTSNITCAVKKRVGNGALTDAPANEYTLKYRKDDAAQESSYPSGGIRIDTITSNIQFILYDKQAEPVAIDKERIPVVVDGSDGRAITGTSEHYKVSNLDGSAGHQEAKPIPDGQENASLEWTTDPNAAIASWGENAKYLWNYEKVVYSSGTTPVRTTPRVIAIWTEDGADGRGIDSIANYYAINDDPTTAPVSGWDDDPMAPTEEQPYLWNYEVITWTDGTTTGSVADAHVIGHYGKDGEDGLDAAAATLTPGIVSIPTDGDGKVLEDFRQEVKVSIYTASDLSMADLAILSGGANVEIGPSTLVSHKDSKTTFSGTKAIIGNASFDGSKLVIEDMGSSLSSSTLIVTAKKGTVLTEHVCVLQVKGYDEEMVLYTARAALGIQRNVRGADGLDGTDGYNTSVVSLYQRYAPTEQEPAPAMPSGPLTYTFQTGLLTPEGSPYLNGWSQQPPTALAGTKLFITQATAASRDATDEILANEWAEPVELLLDGKNGENAVRIDIDNEADMVQTDSTGKVLAARNIVTTVRVYDGDEPQSIENPTVPGINVGTGTNLTPDIATAADGKGKVLTWAFTTEMTLQDVYDIAISYTYNGKQHTTHFSLSASKGLAICQLKPDMSSIPFAYSNGAYTPASRTLTLKVAKTDSNVETEVNASDYGLSLIRYSFDAMPASMADGTAWPGNGGITVANSRQNVFVALFNSAGTMIDRESVPVVKDGVEGAPGAKSATVVIYKRAASQPDNNDRPDGNTIYTFAAGSLAPAEGTDMNGWGVEMPSVNDANPLPCWVRRATALSTGATDTIATGQWSGDEHGNAFKFVENGGNGQNAIVCDLDNEHEDFLYNDAGENISGSATSQGHLYDGHDDVKEQVQWQIRDTENGTWGPTTNTNATASISNTAGSKGLLTVTGLIASSVKIQVRAEYPASSGSYRYAEFTANKSSQDKYDLVLTPNSISYNSADYPQAGRAISLGARRTDLQGTTTNLQFGAYNDKSKISSTTGKGYLRLFIYKKEAVAPGVYDYKLSQHTTSSFTVLSAYCQDRDSVRIVLRKYDNCETSDSDASLGRQVDNEDIPITKAVNGNNGEAAVNVIVSPASLIVNQDMEDPDNLDSLSEQILFSVMKGDTPLSVTRIEVPSTGDNVPVNCEVTGSDSYYATLTAISKDSEGKYYDNGYFICNVYYTDGGSTKSVNGIKVKVYANLLGSWAERVEADAKIEVARSLTYGYDPNYDPETEDPLPLENFGEYIKSSEINVSTLTKKVNDGKNLLSGVLTAMGWMSDTTATSLSHTAKIDSDDWIKVGVSGDTYLKTPPFQVESGKSYKISFETSSTAAVSVQVRRVDTGAAIATWTTDSGNVYHVAGWDSTYSGTVFVIVAATGLRHPQVEEGTEATAFEASTSETSSQIKQTADGITQTVNKISPSKNMFKGALSGEGWKSLASATAVSGAPAVKLDTDGYMNTVEGGSYIEKDVTLSAQKTYTLSFYSKKTTTINVTIFVIGYPTMYVSYNIEGPVPESERKVLTFTLPAALSGTMGISINAPNIRFPQIELGSSPTDFIADTVETSSQITQTADEIKEVIHDELGETGIDIAHGEIELKANKTKFSTSAGVPMIAVQMCNANGEVGTGSGYTIPSIVFYDGQIGATGVSPQWVLNYLGFVRATNAGEKFSWDTVSNILNFEEDPASLEKYEHEGLYAEDYFCVAHTPQNDLAYLGLANRKFYDNEYIELMYLFNSGYYINQGGTKTYQPTDGIYYQCDQGLPTMRRYWLTNTVNSNFVPDDGTYPSTYTPISNHTASGYYYIDEGAVSDIEWPTNSDWYQIETKGPSPSPAPMDNTVFEKYSLVYFDANGVAHIYKDAFIVAMQVSTYMYQGRMRYYLKAATAKINAQGYDWLNGSLSENELKISDIVSAFS